MLCYLQEAGPTVNNHAIALVTSYHITNFPFHGLQPVLGFFSLSLRKALLSLLLFFVVKFVVNFFG